MRGKWESLQKEWFGGKYASMPPVGAIRARCSDDAERIEELERELAEQVLCNGKGAEREADLRGKVERLERENAKLKEEVERIMFILRMRTRAVSASAMTAFPPLPNVKVSNSAGSGDTAR